MGRHQALGGLPAHLCPTQRPVGGLDASAGSQSRSIQCAQTVQVSHPYCQDIQHTSPHSVVLEPFIYLFFNKSEPFKKVAPVLRNHML